MPIVITAIRMEGGDTDLDITQLWWQNPATGYSDCSALETIISYIEDLKGKAYVRDDDGYFVRVGVVVPESGPKFRSTYGDREWTDHLLFFRAASRMWVRRQSDGNRSPALYPAQMRTCCLRHWTRDARTVVASYGRPDGIDRGHGTQASDLRSKGVMSFVASWPYISARRSSAVTLSCHSWVPDVSRTNVAISEPSWAALVSFKSLATPARKPARNAPRSVRKAANHPGRDPRG